MCDELDHGKRFAIHLVLEMLRSIWLTEQNKKNLHFEVFVMPKWTATFILYKFLSKFFPQKKKFLLNVL